MDARGRGAVVRERGVGARLRSATRWMIALALATGTSGAVAAESVLPDGFNAVVVDAGHGGEDHGAQGPAGLLEKDLVLDISERLVERLRAQNLRVVLTRDSDVFVPLETRTSAANDARGDLFISIHANAARSAEVRGIETYFASLDYTDEAARRIARRENDAFGAAAAQSLIGDPLQALLGDMIATEHMLESSEFARLAQTELDRLDAVPSRGVKQAPFVVLMGVQMPAALVEIGFLTNSKDERKLSQSERRDALADALARAVLAFGKRYDERRGVNARLGALQSGD